jgi:hypothetical protein
MPLTTQQRQALLVLRVGDVDPETGDPTTQTNGIVAANVALLWEAYADKAAVDPDLQELYARRDALEMVRGVLASQVDFSTENQSVKQSQRVQDYRDRSDAVTAEIQRLEAVAAAGGAGGGLPVVGQLTTSAPIGPPSALGPDANNVRYGGSPYRCPAPGPTTDDLIP